MSTTMIWLFAGAAFIAVEIFGIPGVGFLFAGIAALVVGGAIEFDLIAADAVLAQAVLFTVLTCVSAALLWKKLKVTRGSSYSNMVGEEATVMAPGLSGSREGQVKWSGTLMRARIDASAGVDVLAAGMAVRITAVEGTLLIVAPAR